MSEPRTDLFRRSDGNWYVVYLDDGRRRWKSTNMRVKHEAMKLLIGFNRGLSGNRFLPTRQPICLWIECEKSATGTVEGTSTEQS
jgi:hypothetical protein